jgi:hypothetical protein
MALTDVEKQVAQQDVIASLRATVEAEDVDAFADAVEAIDWVSRPPEDFAAAVHLALTAGAHLLARRLAVAGHRQYPTHDELDEMSYILGPPTAKPSTSPADPSGWTNLKWLRDHAAEYYGEWIALKDGQLIAHAPTAYALKQQLPTVRGFFLTRAV